jgi:osmotically-inducible protein OsmY
MGMVSFLLGAAAGAAAGYFLDPDSGGRRRATTRDQALSKARQRKDQTVRAATHAASQAQGAVRSAVPSRGGEALDDVGLARKVETEIFRAADAPKGQVSVNAENGVVFLRGEVADAGWRERLAEAAREVDGVVEVRSLLHEPGTPAPSSAPTGATTRSSA